MNKKGIQKAIRQMILIGVIIGAIMAATGDHTASYAAASFLVPLPLVLLLRVSFRSFEEEIVASVNKNAEAKENPPEELCAKWNVCPVIVPRHDMGIIQAEISC